MPAVNASEKAKEKAELGTRIASRLSLVRVTGLEPAQPCDHKNLNLTRLPIPPHPHMLFDNIYNIKTFECRQPLLNKLERFVIFFGMQNILY